jgi:hypothetical protein
MLQFLSPESPPHGILKGGAYGNQEESQEESQEEKEVTKF